MDKNFMVAKEKRKSIAPTGSAKSGQQDKLLEVLAQFRVVFKSVRRHYQEVQEKTNVSGAQLWALAYVANVPACTVGELARGLAIHQSTGSNLLKRLVKLDLVTRRREGEDQRVVTLHLTAEGKKALKRAPRPLIGVLQQGLMGLSERDPTDLHRHLEKLIFSMRVSDKTARTTPLSDI